MIIFKTIDVGESKFYRISWDKIDEINKDVSDSRFSALFRKCHSLMGLINFTFFSYFLFEKKI